MQIRRKNKQETELVQNKQEEYFLYIEGFTGREGVYTPLLFEKYITVLA